jgi:hypothetical protein
MTVLFDDQSKNVATITPYEVEFRMITPARSPSVAFTRHGSDLLDYRAGEVRVTASSLAPAIPARLSKFSAWTLIEFNH